MSAPEYMTQQLDAALAEYTPGIDRAVRFVTIDQVDMLAEFYLHSRTPKPDPRDEVIKGLMDALNTIRVLADHNIHGEPETSAEDIHECVTDALAAAKAVQP